MADTLERENGDIGTNHDKLGTSDKVLRLLNVFI